MRISWTDSRLDDFAAHTDRRFDDLSNRVDDLGNRVSELSRRVDEGFGRIDGRIDSLQHTILLVGGGLFAAFVAVLAAMLGLIATQL